MAAMLQSGLDISAHYTHRFNVDEFQKALWYYASANSAKGSLDWE